MPTMPGVIGRRIYMRTEFRHTLLRRLRGQIVGWSIGLVLYSLMLVAIFPTVSQMEDLERFLAAYPEEMLGFFEMLTEIHTPVGYLDTYFFNYMPLIIGIFVVGIGTKLLVADEERGVLDLILAHPVSRTGLYLGRVLAFIAAIGVILMVCWLSWTVPARQAGMDLSWLAFLRPFIPLFVLLLCFGALGLVLSLVLPAARLASMVTGALLVANYLLRGLANLDDRLATMIQYTPMHYYQGATAVDGLNWGWLAALGLVTTVLIVAGWVLFQRREIRVGGEHSWSLTDVFRLLRRS